jgi:hypothetical protein
MLVKVRICSRNLIAILIGFFRVEYREKNDRGTIFANTIGK